MRPGDVFVMVQDAYAMREQNEWHVVPKDELFIVLMTNKGVSDDRISIIVALGGVGCALHTFHIYDFDVHSLTRVL